MKRTSKLFLNAKCEVILLFMLTCLVSGCGEKGAEPVVTAGEVYGEMVDIPNTDLAYDAISLVVYKKSLSSYGYVSYNELYSGSGKLMRYEEGAFVEIEDDAPEVCTVDYEKIEELLTKALSENNNEKSLEEEKIADYLLSEDEDKSAANIFWNCKLKSTFAENFAKAHAEDIDNAYSVRIYFDIDENYHACGSMVYGRGDTYSQHVFDEDGYCDICGYTKKDCREFD